MLPSTTKISFAISSWTTYRWAGKVWDEETWSRIKAIVDTWSFESRFPATPLAFFGPVVRSASVAVSFNKSLKKHDTGVFSMPIRHTPTARISSEAFSLIRLQRKDEMSTEPALQSLHTHRAPMIARRTSSRWFGTLTMTKSSRASRAGVEYSLPREPSVKKGKANQRSHQDCGQLKTNDSFIDVTSM